MRFVVQRVLDAQVTVDGNIIGKIKEGFLVLCGVSDMDSEATADKMLKKLIGLRIFRDEEGKTNLSIKDVKGELLMVSQFTLYADCKKGNRPSFVKAGAPDHANRLYEYLIEHARKDYDMHVETGEFGADMTVSLTNQGPFTVVLDSVELGIE